MKGDFHLAGFNYTFIGMMGEWRRTVPLRAPGFTFAASLHSSRFINLGLLSSGPAHTTGSRGMAQPQPLATGEAGSPALWGGSPHAGSV